MHAIVYVFMHTYLFAVYAITLFTLPFRRKLNQLGILHCAYHAFNEISMIIIMYNYAFMACMCTMQDPILASSVTILDVVASLKSDSVDYFNVGYGTDEKVYACIECVHACTCVTLGFFVNHI